MRAFLSSTFCDLKFERRFVIRTLKKSGIDVVSMEADFKKEFDWWQWSINQARQCDLLIFLFDQRVGTQADLFSVDEIFHSISKEEADSARGKAIKLLGYRLQRRFPDEEKLFTPEEKGEYLETVVREDGRFVLGAMLEAALRDGVLIESVAELERRLKVDTLVSSTNFFFHKMRRLRRSYFDASFCAWHHAFQDESYVALTHRWSWQLRKLMLASFIPLAALYYALPLRSAVLCSASLLLFIGVMTLAFWPSFVWVGTKTIMVRGLFGRFVQRPINEGVKLKPHWALLHYWTGLGGLSVEFYDGVRVFVPLVDDPTAFARELPALLKERKGRRTRANKLTHPQC
ncbi:hypothetical protein ACVWWO_006455 [Bradyrhizobium sp. F1.13.1]